MLFILWVKNPSSFAIGSNFHLVPIALCICLHAQSCPTLCNPMDWRLAGSSVHGISQARILEWVAISFSRGSSYPGIKPASPASPALAGRFFTTEPPGHAPFLFFFEYLLNFNHYKMLETHLVFFWPQS